MSDIPKLSLPPSIVYPMHMILGLFLIILCIIYMTFKYNGDNNNTDNKNTETLDKFNLAVYIILGLVGLSAFTYHSHLFAKLMWPDRWGRLEYCQNDVI
jgi:hypothetical protein